MKTLESKIQMTGTNVDFILEGIKTAKLNRKQIGRIKGNKYTTKKETAAKEIILKNSKDFNGTNTDSEVIKIAGISRNSYYKYKAELKQTAGD